MRRPKTHAKIPFDTIQLLPFVRDATPDECSNGLRGRFFWSVIPSGDYAQDCATGSGLADLALDYMARNNTPQLVQWAVLDMIGTVDKYFGIEVGFLSRVGRRAMIGHAYLCVNEAGNLSDDVVRVQ